ncbi:MAG: cysteine hydrolase family protein [Bryobacteraceae bacterium]
MTVHFDIDTQLDFMVPAGALYVPGAESLLPAIARLNRKAGVVVSTMCAHGENDAEFKDWPSHCVLGALGQRKPAITLLDRPAVVTSQPGMFDIAGASQILLEKQQLDLFTNPNLPALLDSLHAAEFVVYGVVTEYCVRFAALGLLATGRPVTLVTDAMRSLSDAASDTTLREFVSGGGRLATVSQVCAQ